ncbi:cupredoxin family copper-binding protein [Pseudaminobacter sp. 19-2017]|uniref:Cupredoxin family copper-binding protein n=1 Tax=Pseudaminobacter soli (ex Zhang et al. 2022) TaxID=2831468 RepID=A0A942DYR7_9HYPH|nr:cupredoxin family copper-binding protein [Pseudaminobacter soli]MBS3650694.1 cupredoxin family copper-binding protein [Pseudaminobacter soli]
MSLPSCLPRLVLASCTVVILASWPSLIPASSAEPAVTISNFAFVPDELKVAAGSAVTFKNGDDTVHSIVADDGSFRSPALDTDGEFSHTFSQPGTFTYHCGLHPFMQGRIVVQ